MRHLFLPLGAVLLSTSAITQVPKDQPFSRPSASMVTDTNAWLIERLLANPAHKLALLPGGESRAEKLTTVGKTADLVLIEGDPEARISDLRQTRWVMLDGKLLNADDLRSTAGFSGRPH